MGEVSSRSDEDGPNDQRAFVAACECGMRQRYCAKSRLFFFSASWIGSFEDELDVEAFS